MSKKVFIVSNPRSGSTLLTSIFAHNGYKNLGENRWLWFYCLRRKSPLEFAYRRIVSKYINYKNEGKNFVEKTPSIIGYLRGYLPLLPKGAIVIYIHRDFSDFLPSARSEWMGNSDQRKSHDSIDVRSGNLMYGIKKLLRKNDIFYRVCRPVWWPTFFVSFVSFFGYIIRRVLKMPFVFGLYSREIWLNYFLGAKVDWLIWLQWQCGLKNIEALKEWDGEIYKLTYEDILLKNPSFINLCLRFDLDHTNVRFRDPKYGDYRYPNIDLRGKKLYDSI